MAGHSNNVERKLTLKFQEDWLHLYPPSGQELHWSLSDSLREYFSNQATIRVRLKPGAGLRVHFEVQEFNHGSPKENELGREVVDTSFRGVEVLVPVGHFGEANYTAVVAGYTIKIAASNF